MAHDHGEDHDNHMDPMTARVRALETVLTEKGLIGTAELERAESKKVAAEIAALTPREQEVLACIGKGASNKEIAQQLHLSEGTVKNYITSVLGQLGLRDRTQAALFFQKIEAKKKGSGHA